MDKYVIRLDDPCDHLPHIRCEHCKPATPVSAKGKSLLSSYEIDGRVLPEHRRSLQMRMLQSYSELGGFPQSFPTSLSQRDIEEDFAQLRNVTTPPGPRFSYSQRFTVASVEFDSKGIYLASANKSGHLIVREFETLYCSASNGSYQASDPVIFFFPTRHALEAVKWNPANEEELACVATGNNQVLVYDITSGHNPSRVLQVRSSASPTGFHMGGLHDLFLSKLGTSRVWACGKDGNVHIWDRRAKHLSYAALRVPTAAGALNSLQLSSDEQIAYAGSEGGHIQSWDLRGGTRSAAFVACGEVYHAPLIAIQLSALLNKIPSLRAQTEIRPSPVHSISLDSSCEHRLAFHLNNGWSGVLDMTTLEITHLHCPPPPSYAYTSSPATHELAIRRPAWIPSLSVYAVGAPTQCKIHMLDFSRDNVIRHSVDHEGSTSGESDGVSRFRVIQVPTSDILVAVAAHPLNDHLVAGTESGRLLLLGQKKSSSSQEHGTSSSQGVPSTP